MGRSSGHSFDYQPEFSFIVIGQKKTKPPLSETYRRALEWMLQITRTPVTYGDRHNGLAAYVAWSEQLLRDEDFPNDEVILRQRNDVHNSVVNMVAEARWYGARFLVGMADHVDTHVHRDMIEPLLYAAACYTGEHALMWKLWDLTGGIGGPDAYRYFADPAVRRQMAPVIQQARDQHAQAADHIQRALASSPRS